MRALTPRTWLTAQSLPLVTLAIGASVTAAWPALAPIEATTSAVLGIGLVLAYLYRVHKAAPMWLIPVMLAMFTLAADGAAAIPPAVRGNLGAGVTPAIVIAVTCAFMLELAVAGAVLTGARNADPPLTDNRPTHRGGIRVDYAPDSWIPCPPAAEVDRTLWARAHALGRWSASGREYRDPEVTNLARTLATIHTQAYRDGQTYDALIHMPDLDTEPLLVTLHVWPAEGDRDTQLRNLTHADDQNPLLPVLVRPFTTEALGTGLRTLRYTRHKRSVIAVVAYAWRSERYETAVCMHASSPDPSRLQRALADMDRLAHAISLFLP
jgi:hypothetical protein